MGAGGGNIRIQFSVNRPSGRTLTVRPNVGGRREIAAMTSHHDPLTSSQASAELHTEAEDSQVTVSSVSGQTGICCTYCEV